MTPYMRLRQEFQSSKSKLSAPALFNLISKARRALETEVIDIFDLEDLIMDIECRIDEKKIEKMVRHFHKEKKTGGRNPSDSRFIQEQTQLAADRTPLNRSIRIEIDDIESGDLIKRVKREILILASRAAKGKKGAISHILGVSDRTTYNLLRKHLDYE